ncbi:restriction endonuclease subunit S [Flavobacterium marginilacus]|uniref:restriction endonuclease subunit S n=1 Tax=Flavobacterium marginilacus TaxID=3003256 RepID=UPI00248D86D4|nr:restriction endonuclease subunit S [Flavobacterium marginilacus]
MKRGWEVKKLKEVCAKITDGTHQTPKYFDDGVVFLSSKNVTSGKIDWNNIKYIDEKQHLEMHKRVAPRVGDILLAKNGTTGVAAMVDKDVVFDIYVSLAHIRVLDKVSPHYMLYFINSPIAKKQFNKRLKGSGVPNLHLEEIREVEIPFPSSLQEQQSIVSILDEAFTAIDKAKAKAQQNLKNAKELFESYLQNLFLNPKENWQIKKWGDLCHFVRGPFGGSLKKSIFKESGYVVYEQKHAIHDHFNQLRYFIDEEKFNEMARFEVKSGDIIMSCSGVTLGRVAIVPDGIPRGIINQALLKLTPNKDVSAHFLKHWLRSKIFQDIIFRYSGGAAIPNVPSAKILKDIKIPFPKLDEQNKIVNEIETVLIETKRLEAIYQQKINDLEELKKSILQKAFAGELTNKKLEYEL